jgi:hypothetical protein
VTAPNEVNQDPAAAAAQLTPDEQLDLLEVELDQRRARRVAREAAKAEQDKARDDRGCVDCGASLSWDGWHPGPRCHPCWLDRGGDAGAGTDDRPVRVKACDLVLGDIGPPEWATAVPGPPTVAARWHADYKADAFRWFSEVPGARPAPGAERFAYVTAEQLRDRLYEGREPRPPQLHSRGRRYRCESCGAKGEVWTVEQVGVSAPVDSRGEVRSNRAYFRATWTCHSCGHQDVEQRPEQLPGVPVGGLVG